MAGGFALVVALATFDALRRDLWDDALFLLRFANNFVTHGVFAWNVADGPVHGNTSQLFQLVATAVVGVAPGAYHVTIKLLSGFALVATWVTSAVTLRRLREPEPGPLYVLLCGLTAPTVLGIVSSGMETLLALWVLATFLLIVAILFERGVRSTAAETAMFAAGHVAVYLVRPDMALMTLTLALGVLYEPDRRWFEQRRLARLVLAALAANAVLLGVLALYYGTAFPLSAYLKNRLLSPYSPRYQDLGIVGERRHLATWALLTVPFVAMALFRRDRLVMGLLGGAALFVVYHQQTTLGIMGYHGRFFLPATLPVVLAAALAWPAFLRTVSGSRVIMLMGLYAAGLALAHEASWIEDTTGFYLGRLRWSRYVAYLAPLAVLAAVPAAGRWRNVLVTTIGPLTAVLVALWAYPLRSLPALDDEVATKRITRRMKAMVGIRKVRKCLPDTQHLYHSELGVPGVLFPDARVTDLSGLMNPRLTFERLPFDAICLPDPPEILFLPHRTHAELNAEILDSTCIQQFARPEGIPESSSTLFVRRDRLDAFERCTSPSPKGARPRR
ncbi:MAG: hypothetical protein AAGA48_18355 [Myxococcota bacterium]